MPHSCTLQATQTPSKGPESTPPYGSRVVDLVCAGETVGKIGEVDEMGERELVLVVNVMCGKE